MKTSRDSEVYGCRDMSFNFSVLMTLKLFGGICRDAELAVILVNLMKSMKTRFRYLLLITTITTTNTRPGFSQTLRFYLLGI